MPNVAELKERLFHVDGVLFWKTGLFPGKKAGHLHLDGYWIVRVNGVEYLGHRVVWALEHDEWPAHPIDHIDRDKANNRPSNLRCCTDSQNQWNRSPNKGRKFKGVFSRENGRFRARIVKDKKAVHLGSFGSEEEAARAYDIAAIAMHGEFAYRNFPDEVIA